MRLKKKISRQSKIFKKAINAKWAFYWAKFMTEAATICRKYTHINAKIRTHESNIQVAADRYAMARIRTVVLWSNQTE